VVQHVGHYRLGLFLNPGSRLGNRLRQDKGAPLLLAVKQIPQPVLQLFVAHHRGLPGQQGTVRWHLAAPVDTAFENLQHVFQMNKRLAGIQIAGVQVGFHVAFIDAGNLVSQCRDGAGFVVEARQVQQGVGNALAVLPNHLFRFGL